MNNRLEIAASSLLLLQNTETESLLLSHEEDDNDGDAENNQDNGESTKGPSEVGSGQEELGDVGAGKGGGDQGSGVDAEHDQTVLEGGHIGQHDGDDVEKPNVADPVDGGSRSVHLDAVAGGHENHTDNDEKDHEDEALDTTPDVDDLGNGKLADTTDKGRNDAGRRQKTVLGECRGDIGSERALDGQEERVDEADKVEPV